jgi:4-carboxymuconolactone decarboxylase
VDKSGFEVIAPDESLLGPLNPLLFSPVLGAAQIDVFHADKSATSLSPRVHEVVVLTVGAAWGSDYELYAHSAVGKLAGLSDDVVDALLRGQPPDLRNEQDETAYEFTRELVHDHRVEPETYARAEHAFGHKGLVDMVLLVGLYLATCSLINAFEVPAVSWRITRLVTALATSVPIAIAGASIRETLSPKPPPGSPRLRSLAPAPTDAARSSG